MRDVKLTTAFKKDYKKLFHSGQVRIELLEEVVAMLAGDIQLPRRYRDHPLSGDWEGHRECHIRPDWLLIYKLSPGKVYLARSGSHAELF